MRVLLILLVAVLGMASAWQWRETLGFTQAPAAANAKAARKCVPGGPGKGQVIYTNEACPPGSREQALSGGTLNIVKSTPASPPAAASRPAHVRDLLVDPKAADIKERRMEAVIGK